MQKVKPKKALGQHFLTDLSIARRIADTLSDYKDVPVMEVGPGMGVLTQFLVQQGHDVSRNRRRECGVSARTLPGTC